MYAENNLSPAQSAERLADYFCSISQECESLSLDQLPPWVCEKLEKGKSDNTKPFLEDWDVYKRPESAKKPNSSVPGDLPVKVVKEFAPELAKPVAIIFNFITQTGEYPRQWVVEHQLSIPKVNPPQSEEDLRNISSTAFLSKVYECFVGQWLFPYVEPSTESVTFGLFKTLLTCMFQAGSYKSLYPT